MKGRSFSRRLLAASIVALLFSPAFAAAGAAEASKVSETAAAPKGLRVYSAGHSFHYFLPPILAEIAKSAGIADHKQVGLSAIGGSYIYQHWAKDGEKDAKASISREKPDIFTMAPIYLPDDGIENFVKLVAEKSPHTRVLLQEFWLPYDVYDVNYKKQKPATPDRDAMTVDYLRTEYGKYFKAMDAYVEELNKKFGKQIVYVTPVGQAVVALRAKVIAGEAPGIAKQSDLFTDAIGHCTNPVKVLNAYCHYAVIYGKSPVGLPVPVGLKSEKMDEATTAKLNTLLQQIAWQAATEHPLSGVKK